MFYTLEVKFESLGLFLKSFKMDYTSRKPFNRVNLLTSAPLSALLIYL